MTRSVPRPLDTPVAQLRAMQLIRSFEMRVDALFAAGELRGTSHLAVGEEATAVGVCAALTPDDYLTSTHRGHGHFLARGGDPRRIMAELFGKVTGYAEGRGGTQHMADYSLGFLGMNGITAGMMAIATGAAFSARYRKSGQVAAAFFGDGASNQGTFHEALNLAAIWALPVVFVCENNLYAMSSPACAMLHIANIADRAAAYGIPGVVVDGNDVTAVHDAMAAAAARARRGDGPTLLEAKTYRVLGHSRGDLCVYRTRDEEAAWRETDPVAGYAATLLADGTLDAAAWVALQEDVTREVADAEAFARASALPEAMVV